MEGRRRNRTARIIPAGESNIITLDCTVAAAIGTAGGQFLGSKGELIGSGEQRFAAMNLQYNCHDVITIIYELSDAGFKTTLLVE